MQRSLFWLLDQYPETGESLTSLLATALGHACLADRLGYNALWLAEHHFHTLGTAANPAVVLSAMSQRTERLRLGPAVSVLPLRDPIQVAEDYALVDVLSNGRLNMGVGSGSQPIEFAGFGAEFECRSRIFNRNLNVLRQRWAAAAAGERGPAALNVAPLQSPAPPIYVATNREDGARDTGRTGNSMLTLVSPQVSDLAEIKARIEAHARGLKEAGHPQDSAEVVVVAFAHVDVSEQQAKNVVAPALGRLLKSLTGTAPPEPRDLCDQMVERGTGLFGTSAQVEEQIDRYARLGVTHMAFVSRFGGMAPELAQRNLRELAPSA